MSRHGPGETIPDVRSGESRPVYDPAQRAIALELDDAHPNWLVMWGVGIQKYEAYPCFDGGRRVSSADPRELTLMMAQEELNLRPWRY